MKYVILGVFALLFGMVVGCSAAIVTSKDEVIAHLMGEIDGLKQRLTDAGIA